MRFRELCPLTKIWKVKATHESKIEKFKQGIGDCGGLRHHSPLKITQGVAVDSCKQGIQTNQVYPKRGSLASGSQQGLGKQHLATEKDPQVSSANMTANDDKLVTAADPQPQIVHGNA